MARPKTYTNGILLKLSASDADSIKIAARKAGFDNVSEWLRTIVKKEIERLYSPAG